MDSGIPLDVGLTKGGNCYSSDKEVDEWDGE